MIEDPNVEAAAEIASAIEAKPWRRNLRDEEELDFIEERLYDDRT